ncbi:hypothetical protein K443DRAFT_672708 [Laccaria amethystina LaAM-08-1]|uniref:Ubiquitin thioesterase OTU n=1 Tax=Laccaria amethystina LaAM-08-1 TaxID=1095629 RepID=A0A0C9X7K2_9AGAR|nr:hypothetical protein K443DRAFT_672708 [Laccaria amethystina LaAM-08-1]
MIRLRHPKGVSTIQLDSVKTVNDLQQNIYTTTQILPSRQILKSGYPLRPLTLVPELPIDSLDIKHGDQIIVSELTTHEIVRDSPRPPPVTPSTHPYYIDVDGSVLVHRIVPDDNSCLFSSVALIFEQSIQKASQMRKIVAEGIQRDPETYNEAILGMPPSQYIATITKPTSWGGAIELGVLAAHYSAEIASIDVETGRIDRFSPGANPERMRCLLIYSGIHYDAASLAPMPDAPDEWHQTLFPVVCF